MCLEMHVTGTHGVPNFGKDHEVNVNHLVVTIYVSLNTRVRRTLYDLYCSYFLRDVLVKFARETFCEA